MQNLDEACLVEFGFCFFKEPCYEEYCEQLKYAIRNFTNVYVLPKFKDKSVDFQTYQRFLTHIYATIAQETRENCDVIVIDPSISISRVLKEKPWKTYLTTVSKGLLSFVDDKEKLKGNELRVLMRNCFYSNVHNPFDHICKSNELNNKLNRLKKLILIQQNPFFAKN